MEHNHHLAGWNLDDTLNLSTNRRSIRPEDELVELLWRDGQVVLHSQTQRQQQQPLETQKQDQETLITSNNNTSPFLEDQETVSWIQYPPDSDPFESEDFSSHFFSSIDPITTSETPKHEPQAQEAQAMAPPKFRFTDSSSQGKEQYSVNTVGSSHDCASNQSRNDLDLVNTTSSSGGSSGCITDRKRKHKIENTVSESDVKSKGSTRRSRAAEVHNLSERRRRDRINERMKALQELIPHCSKTDKASILDEAIDYLKSLQLQIQMMWMGSGMAAATATAAAPMMFPGIQTQPPPFIRPMGLQIQSPVQLPQFPILDRNHPGLVCQTPVYFPQMQAVQSMETLRIASPAGRKSQKPSVPTTTTDGPP